MTATQRVYRFSPRDAGGWLLGLSGAQCTLVGAGLAGVGVALRLGAPPLGAGLLLLAAAALAFMPWEGTPAHRHIGTVAGHGRRRRAAARYELPLPLFGYPPGRGRSALGAPPTSFGRCELIEVTAPGGARLGAVCDERGRLTAAVRAGGAGFSLAERAEQDRLLAGWGEVLASFCAEGGAVRQLTVSQCCTAGSIGEADAYLERHRVPGAEVAAYRELLGDAQGSTRSSDVLIALTVDGTRPRRGRGAAADVLAEEVGRLCRRLEAAGLADAAALDPVELTDAIRDRLDPIAAPARPRRFATLTEAAERLVPRSIGPASFAPAWTHVAVDATVHAGFWVAEWPRLELGPTWLDGLLAAPGSPRTFVLYIEPVAPSAARRRIERDATRLATDAEQRSRGGFRIGARHRRVEEAVADREAELVAGFAEVAFAGVLLVSAPDVEELEAAATSYAHAAASVGLELQRLEGRHDLALALSLPLGRPVAAPRLA